MSNATEPHDVVYTKPISLRLQILFWLMAWIPVIVLVAFFLKFTVNAPSSDDFDAILGFLNRYFPENRWNAFFSLTELHNEHRIILTRFLAWLNVILFGKVSFTGLTVIANASLLLLAGVLIRLGRKEGLRDFWLIPVLCLILVCQDSSNMLIAMFGLQNLIVHAFAAVSFLTWNRSRLWSAVFGTLAVCTSSCGLLIFPILSAFEIYATITSEKKGIMSGVRQAVTTNDAFPLLLCVCVWGLYFWGYHSPPHHPSLLTGFKIPHRFAQYIVLLMGTPLSQFGHPMTHVFGLSFLCLMCAVLWKSDWRKHSTLVCLIFFELGTMFIIASARCGFGSGHPYNTRYRIIALTLWACTYLLAADLLRQRLTLARFHTVGIWLASLAIAFNLLTSRYSIHGFQRLNQSMSEQLSPQQANLRTIEGSEHFYEIAIESQSKGLFHWQYLRQSDSTPQ